MMKNAILTLASVGALALVPSSASAASWHSCKAPNKTIHNLVASNVSCTFAGYFSRGFKLGALYQGSPYRATYRGFTCSIATDQHNRYISCSKGRQSSKQLIRFRQSHQ
jgi:hypothetical protein